MDNKDCLRREQRLDRMVQLAMQTRRWSKSELARFLECDPSTLCPKNGNVRIDPLLRLAEALDWPMEAVLQELGAPTARRTPTDLVGQDFENLDAQSLTAHAEGRWEDLLDIAERMFLAASTGEQRALARNREFGGWDGLGHYQRALEASRRGLEEDGVSMGLQLMLQCNMANAHYALGHLLEARAIAEDLIRWYQAHPPTTLRDRANEAFIHYVLGHTWRRLMGHPDQSDPRCAASAKNHLEMSFEALSRLAAEFPAHRDSFSGIANTCRFGLIEVEVELGRRAPQEAIEELYKGMSFRHTNQYPAGDWLESYAWGAVFGANIAARRLSGATLHLWMKALTEAASDIGRRLKNWALRQQVLFMKIRENEVHAQTAGTDVDISLDDDELHWVSGAMGRSAVFREHGWKVLETSGKVKVAAG